MAKKKPLKKESEIEEIDLSRTLELPDPGLNGAIFLAWLRKRSGVKKLSYCKKKWKPLGFNVEFFVMATKKEGKSRYNDNLIQIARSAGRGGAGERYITLTDRGDKWAENWTNHYRTKFPHHSQWQAL